MSAGAPPECDSRFQAAVSGGVLHHNGEAIGAAMARDLGFIGVDFRPVGKVNRKRIRTAL
jgi:hypothetical protein